MSTLSRLSAPQQLEVNLHNADGIADDLVARVEHELAHPEEVIGERLGRIAHRYEAPAELEQLVARDLASGAQRSGRRFMRLVPGLVLAAAASLVMLFNLKGVEPVKPSLDSLSFSVREVNSISELNPMAQLLVGGVTGGASDAREF